MKLSWRQTSEAKILIKLAKSVMSLRKPVADIPHKCTKIVTAINHAIERFEISKKDEASFLTLSQTLDKKLLEIAYLKAQVASIEDIGASLGARALEINVPIADQDGLILKTDIAEAIVLLSDSLNRLREKLDDVERQLEEIRVEACLEVK